MAPGGIGAFAERLAPDLVLSVFYRDLLPAPVLAAARLAALNLHPSLLPAYRGRAPINWVLVRGESQTGVTLHHMIGRVDAGDVVGQRVIAIAPRETALSLYRKVEEEGVGLLAEMLPRVAAGNAPRLPQDGSCASTFGRRRPEDGPGAGGGAAMAGGVRRRRGAARLDPLRASGRSRASGRGGTRCIGPGGGGLGGAAGPHRRPAGAGHRAARGRAGADRHRR